MKALSLLLLFLATNEWHVYASQVLSGMAAAFFSGTVEAIFYESLKEDRREEEMAKVYGKVEGAAMLPKIARLVLGAWLAKDLTMAQFHILIGLNLCLVLLQIFLILRIIEPSGLDNYRDLSSLGSNDWVFRLRLWGLFLQPVISCLIWLPPVSVG